jgi:hypothetical protein
LKRRGFNARPDPSRGRAAQAANTNAANANAIQNERGFLEVEVFLSGLPHLALATGTLEGRRDIQDNAKGTRGKKSQNFDGWHDLKLSD